MSFLTPSLRRGEYCATCLRVLTAVSRCVGVVERSSSLLGDAIEGGVVVETKVTGVNDVVGSCGACEFIQRSKIAWLIRSASLSSRSSARVCSPRTSAIHRTLAPPAWTTRPWLGRSGVAPGTGPDA